MYRPRPPRPHNGSVCLSVSRATVRESQNMSHCTKQLRRITCCFLFWEKREFSHLPPPNFVILGQILILFSHALKSSKFSPTQIALPKFWVHFYSPNVKQTVSIQFCFIRSSSMKHVSQTWYKALAYVIFPILPSSFTYFYYSQHFSQHLAITYYHSLLFL